MKIVIPGSAGATTSCACGWTFPKELAVVPAGMLKGILASPTIALKSFVESVMVTCPKCSKEHVCGEPKIVR